MFEDSVHHKGMAKVREAWDYVRGMWVISHIFVDQEKDTGPEARQSYKLKSHLPEVYFFQIGPTSQRLFNLPKQGQTWSPIGNQMFQHIIILYTNHIWSKMYLF